MMDPIIMYTSSVSLNVNALEQVGKKEEVISDIVLSAGIFDYRRSLSV